MRRQTWLMVVIAGIACTAHAQEAEPTSARATVYDLPSPWEADLTLSWQSLGLSGSDQRYFQYYRPPDGYFVGGFALRGSSADGFPLARLQAFNLGEDNTGGRFVWHGLGVPASLRWDYDRHLFFADPITGAAVGSKRLNNVLRLNYDLPGWLPQVEVGYHHQQLSEPAIARLGGGLGFDSQELSVRTAFAVAGGQLNLSYSNLDFQDDTFFLPSSEIDTYAVDYALDLSRSLSVSALWAKTEIAQTGMARVNEFEKWEWRASYHPRSQFSLSAKYGQRYTDQFSTLNAYTQQVNTGDVRLRYRPLSGLTIRAGVTRDDFERVNRNHTFLDTPLRETTWITARGHLPNNVRLVAKYQKQDLEDRAPSAIPGTADLSPLYRDDRDRWDFRVSGPVGDHGQGYLYFTADDVRNGVRGLHYKTDTVGFGLQSQLSPYWSMAADGFIQNQRRGNPASLADAFGLNNGLSALADSEGYTVSTSYDLDELTTLSGYFTKYRGRGGALINDHEYGFSLRRDLRNGLSCGVEWYRLSHDDNDPGIVPISGLDFNDNRIRVDLTAAF